MAGTSRSAALLLQAQGHVDADEAERAMALAGQALELAATGGGRRATGAVWQGDVVHGLLRAAPRGRFSRALKLTQWAVLQFQQAID